MRLKFIFPALILATTVYLISCNSVDRVANSNVPKPAEIIYPDGVRRITIDELDAMMKSGEAYVVDVRNQASYDIGHIPGSRLIPLSEIQNHINELPRDKTIVTYCS